MTIQLDNLYTISMDGHLFFVPRLKELPIAGQTLVAADLFYTPDGKVYFPGDSFDLLARTEEAPHGRLSSLGNWIVRCKYRTSIWSNIEWSLYEGTLK